VDGEKLTGLGGGVAAGIEMLVGRTGRPGRSGMSGALRDEDSGGKSVFFQEDLPYVKAY